MTIYKPSIHVFKNLYLGWLPTRTVADIIFGINSLFYVSLIIFLANKFK